VLRRPIKSTRTDRLNGWTQSRVRRFRNTHDIAVYKDGAWAKRGKVTLTEAAKMLDLSPMTVLRQIRTGIIPAEQYCKGAPWVIERRNVKDRQRVERATEGHKRPPSSNVVQRLSAFQ